MKRTETVSLGDLVSVFYEEFLALYGDEDLAAVATAATINDLLAENVGPDAESEEAA